MKKKQANLPSTEFFHGFITTINQFLTTTAVLLHETGQFIGHQALARGYINCLAFTHPYQTGLCTRVIESFNHRLQYHGIYHRGGGGTALCLWCFLKPSKGSLHRSFPSILFKSESVFNSCLWHLHQWNHACNNPSEYQMLKIPMKQPLWLLQLYDETIKGDYICYQKSIKPSEIQVLYISAAIDLYHSSLAQQLLYAE